MKRHTNANAENSGVDLDALKALRLHTRGRDELELMLALLDLHIALRFPSWRERLCSHVTLLSDRIRAGQRLWLGVALASAIFIVTLGGMLYNRKPIVASTSSPAQTLLLAPPGSGSLLRNASANDRACSMTSFKRPDNTSRRPCTPESDELHIVTGKSALDALPATPINVIVVDHTHSK
jgi:hypothetical protein